MDNKQARKLFALAESFLKGKPLTKSTPIDESTELEEVKTVTPFSSKLRKALENVGFNKVYSGTRGVGASIAQKDIDFFKKRYGNDAVAEVWQASVGTWENNTEPVAVAAINRGLSKVDFTRNSWSWSPGVVKSRPYVYVVRTEFGEMEWAVEDEFRMYVRRSGNKKSFGESTELEEAKVEKIECLECDEVNTKAKWEKNKGFCPSCKKSSKGVRAESTELEEATGPVRGDIVTIKKSARTANKDYFDKEGSVMKVSGSKVYVRFPGSSKTMKFNKDEVVVFEESTEISEGGDWGSSDWTAALEMMDDILAAGEINPETIKSAAQEVADFYGDDILGYGSSGTLADHAEATDHIIDMWTRRSKQGGQFKRAYDGGTFDEIEEKSAYVKKVEKAMAQEEGYDKGQEFEQDEEGETCIRCGAPLDSEEGLETGICADCWKPEDEDDVEESCGKSHKKVVKEALSNEAHELKSFIENDEDLYMSRLVPVVRNMQRRIRKGTYDHAKAPKLWMHLVNAALPEYAEEYNMPLPQVRTSLFPMSVRQEVAKRMADEYRDEIDAQGGQMFDEGAYGKKKTMKETPSFEADEYYDTWSTYYSRLENAQRLFKKSFFTNGSNSRMAREWYKRYDNFNDEFNKIKELALEVDKNMTKMQQFMDDIEYQINMGLYADEESAREAGMMQP